MSCEKINTFITENILLYDAYTITLHGKCYFGCENGTLKMCTKLLFWYGMDVKMPTTGCNQNCFQFGNARYQQRLNTDRMQPFFQCGTGLFL